MVGSDGAGWGQYLAYGGLAYLLEPGGPDLGALRADDRTRRMGLFAGYTVRAAAVDIGDISPYAIISAPGGAGYAINTFRYCSGIRAQTSSGLGADPKGI